MASDVLDKARLAALPGVIRAARNGHYSTANVLLLCDALEQAQRDTARLDELALNAAKNKPAWRIRQSATDFAFILCRGSRYDGEVESGRFPYVKHSQASKPVAFRAAIDAALDQRGGEE